MHQETRAGRDLRNHGQGQTDLPLPLRSGTRRTRAPDRTLALSALSWARLLLGLLRAAVPSEGADRRARHPACRRAARRRAPRRPAALLVRPLAALVLQLRPHADGAD